MLYVIIIITIIVVVINIVAIHRIDQLMES